MGRYDWLGPRNPTVFIRAMTVSNRERCTSADRVEFYSTLSPSMSETQSVYFTLIDIHSGAFINIYTCKRVMLPLSMLLISYTLYIKTNQWKEQHNAVASLHLLRLKSDFFVVPLLG